MSDGDLVLERAIATISQSDPLLKLLEQVRLGRMKPGDPGLRAIIESWLATYGKSLELPGFTRQALLRLDPGPRLAMKQDRGIRRRNDGDLFQHFPQGWAFADDVFKAVLRADFWFEII